MPRASTADKATLTADLAYFTKDQIGDKRAMTQDGFLLCEDVPIARTGTMLYGPDESPIEVGPDGLARVSRDEEALLSPQTIASFNGKPVTNEHPPEREVTPATARKYQVGTVLNPRRGEGELKDCIVADLLITDRQTIDEVNRPHSPKREVSAGYEAGYDQIEPGVGRQTDILGNHVALVKRGRCGPRCAINDHATQKEPHMGTRVKVNDKRTRVHLLPHVRKAFADAEAAALEAMGLSPDGGDTDPDLAGGDDGGGDGHTHIHLHMGSGGGDDGTPAPVKDEVDPGAGGGAGGGDLESRVAGLEQGMQSIMQVLQEIKDAQGGVQHQPTGDQDPDDDTAGGADEDDPTKVADGKAKTGDSAALANEYQATLALCEVLVPGFKFPTFDAATPRKKTVDNLCSMRRKALGLAQATNDGAALIAKVHGSEPDVDALSCTDVAVLFKASAGAKSLINTRAVTDSARTVPPGSAFKTVGKTGDGAPTKPQPPRTPAELNAFFAKHYGR